MRVTPIAVLSAGLAALAAGGAEAACAAAFTEALDVRGQATCVANDRARTVDLRQQQRRDLRALQDGQSRLATDQRELTRDLAREQTSRANAGRAERNKRRAAAP
jgi:hypothetical protein